MKNIMDINDQTSQEQDPEHLLDRLDLSTPVKPPKPIEQLKTTDRNQNSDSQQKNQNIHLNDQYNENSSNDIFGVLDQPIFDDNQFLQISQMVRSQTLERSVQWEQNQSFRPVQSQELSNQPKKYKQETREDKLIRYKNKKSNRCQPKIKKVQYQCRSKVALNRIRVKGQFQKNKISTQSPKSKQHQNSHNVSQHSKLSNKNQSEDIVNQVFNQN